MGKYNILGLKISSEPSTEVTYNFKNIEEILGFLLPRSARTYMAWWANDHSHSHANGGWLSYGWRVRSVDLVTEIVTFNKYDMTRNKVLSTPNKHESLEQMKGTKQYFEGYCEVCHRKGSVECKLCNGSGIRTEKACENCDGTGMRICPACRGTGMIRIYKSYL